MEPQIPLGTGIYYPAEAARLLGVSASTLRRWVNGYTYWLAGADSPRRRRQGPVIESDLPILGAARALSFLELMELRVVIALRKRGLSLQQIRGAAALARRVLDRSHPFASHGVFTDDKRIFTTVFPGEELREIIELRKHRHAQIIIGQVLAPFLQEVEFDPSTGFAHRWWPRGRSVPVVLDPRIAFGSPVIEGTGIRTSVIARMAGRSGASEVADAYDVSKRGVQAAVEFESLLLAA
jgi:uncharacterized protein (DUF433 family)/DNA-binding transcriptional MerR regulator